MPRKFKVDGIVRSMAATLGLRALLFPLTAVCSLTAQGLMVREIGVAGFGAVSLIVTLPQLIPFADLGLSTAVTNAFARDEPDKERLATVAWTLLLGCATAVFTIGILVEVTIGWGRLLGIDLSTVPTVIKLIFLLTVALNIPIGVGQRILIGTGRVTMNTALGTIQPMIYVTLVFIATRLHAPADYYVALGVSNIVTSIVIIVVATRKTHLPSSTWSRLTVGLKSQRRRLYMSAGPMMIITAGLPLALESHRLVLSHLRGQADLGTYSVAMALYSPTWAMITTMGLNLWPYFAGRRGGASRARSYRRILLGFTVMAVVGGVVFALLAPFVTAVWSGHHVPPRNWWILALLLVVQTIHLPAGMLLTDAKELLFQAVCVVLMATSTLAAMFFVVPHLGAPGPTLCSAICIAIFQLVPCALVASGIWTPSWLKSHQSGQEIPEKAVILAQAEAPEADSSGVVYQPRLADLDFDESASASTDSTIITPRRAL